jgi:hypothetical protein
VQRHGGDEGGSVAPDIGSLDVDVAAAQSAVSDALDAVGTKQQEVLAERPRRTAASYGKGLGDRAMQLVELRRRAHDVRLAHIDRLRAGLENTAGTLTAVSGTDEQSHHVFGAGEGR